MVTGCDLLCQLFFLLSILQGGMVKVQSRESTLTMGGQAPRGLPEGYQRATSKGRAAARAAPDATRAALTG